MGSTTPSPEYDVLIVGAGFGGLYTLHKLRSQGFSARILDDGADLGGVWYWNCYPGARVDTKVPLYEFSDQKIWSDWTWTEKYPGVQEIKRYFAHVEDKLHLKKDISFNTRVEKARWDEAGSMWRVADKSGTERTSRFFVLCTGFAAKPFIPSLPGLETFAGTACHTSRWPQQGIDLKGKKVGVVGNGSSGLQVIQEVAPDVSHLTVFQRSPTYALPMRQKPLAEEDQDKSTYPALYEKRRTTFAGIDQEFRRSDCSSAAPEERRAFFEAAWAEGGLSFWLANYQDVIRDRASNRLAYDFWRSKVLPRISDPAARDLLAPRDPPYHFGTKRATLEQRYYEVYNQPNVALVDARSDPVARVAPSGVLLSSGRLVELDVLVLATGFDSVSGGILAVDVRGARPSLSLRRKWSRGTRTNLGMTTAGFPNLMFLYGPQAPTSFCNGPTCAELQGDWIVSAIASMRDNRKLTLDPTLEAEQEWCDLVNNIGDMTLLPETKSEYMGTNIPGKPKEMLNFLGGLVDYTKRITGVVESGFPGFTVQ
ncbi:FAD/NAD(P)-binding domain-containing protein [Zalerion maritima]|uniref:FAD/NAD(P)-binding domain-containing protein n=1 Tax=Zalerion maritima TaxID=339359 RepID=A0AAD5RLY9_9PEZI|nr:FAD/NAD(P)-binding domain-containing protein [Zalerion maritima]